MGRLQHLSDEDKESFRKALGEKGLSPEAATRKIFRGNTEIAKWMRRRPAMIVINDTLFVHGGVDPAFQAHGLDQVNASVTKWFKHYQGLADRPEDADSWVVGKDGPLWTRNFIPGAGAITEKELDELLEQFGATRVVVGHTVTDKLKTSFEHPDFPGKVFMIDTGISKFYGGKKSALVLKGKNMNLYKIRRQSDEAVLKYQSSDNASDCSRELVGA